MFSLVLGVWQELAATDLVSIVLKVALVLLGNGALFAWGSAADADLDMAVEDPEQTMLVEQLPVTPHRMVLISLNLVFTTDAWLLLWKLSSQVALATMLVIDGAVYVVAWQLGRVALQRLTRGA
jgi:hypothetical protein